MTTIQTSETSPLCIDWVDQYVGLTFAPGKKAPSVLSDTRWDRDVDADLKVIKDAGISVVVTLMQKNEMDTFGIGNLGQKVNDFGMSWFHFPIEDGGVPDSPSSMAPLIYDIVDEARNGKKVLIHCRGGLGRTGTVAGCYLVAQGFPFDYTLEILQIARGNRCPENDMQKDFIRSFEKYGLNRDTI
jgi:protein-tyrosine phosphatase